MQIRFPAVDDAVHDCDSENFFRAEMVDHPGLRQPRLASDCIEGEGIAAAKYFNCVIEKFDFGWHISNIPTIRMVGQLSCGLSRKRSFSGSRAGRPAEAATRRYLTDRNL